MSQDCNAVIILNQRDRINRLMAEEYGLADQVIGLVRDNDAATPIRLDPI